MEYTDHPDTYQETVESTNYYGQYHKMLVNSVALQYCIWTVSFFLVFIDMAVLVSVGNVTRAERDKTSIYMLFGSLSSVECIYNVFVSYTAIRYETINLDASDYKLGAMNLCATVSNLTIVLITMNRYRYILNGIQNRKSMSLNLNSYLMATAWFVGVIIWLLSFGTIDDNSRFMKYLYFLLNVLFMLPFVYVCKLYLTLFCHFCARSKAANESNLNSYEITQSNVELEEEESQRISVATTARPSGSWFLDDGQQIRTDKIKSLKMITFLVLTFSVHCVPFAAVNIVRCFTDCEQWPEKCHYYTWLLGIIYTISIVCKLFNPIIYAVWHRSCNTVQQPDARVN